MAFVTAAATIFTAGYSYYQSRQQASAIKAQGKVNQQLAEVDVRQIQIATQDAIVQRRDQLEKDLGAARAGFSASGVAVNQGSPLEAYNELMSNAADDISALERDSELDVYRARLGAQNAQLVAREQASAARTKGITTVLRTGIGLAREYRPASKATVTIGGKK